MSQRGVIIAFVLVILASVGGSIFSGHQAGESGAKAGRSEIQKVAKKYAYEINLELVKRERAGCSISNETSRESNRRLDLNNKQNEAILKVAKGARKARLASYRRDRRPEDLVAAQEYLVAVQIIGSNSFKNVPMANCAEAFPFPPKP